MPRLRLIIPATAGLLIIVASATTFAPAAPIPEAAKPLYHPIRVGDAAVYDRNGVEETVVVSETKQKEDGWLVSREMVEQNGSKQPRDKVQVSRQGLLVYAEEGEEYDPPLCVLKLPVGGAGWTTESSLRAVPAKLTANSTAAKGGRVRVAAGEFETVRVDSTYTLDGTTKVAATAFFALGVGLVKLEVDGKPHSELKKFTPGKD